MTPAQQAAADEIEDWLQHRDDPLSEPRQSGRFVQQAIDAATAKLREELEIKDELLNKIAGRTGTKTKGIK
jgi:hypothetical protein